MKKIQLIFKLVPVEQNHKKMLDGSNCTSTSEDNLSSQNADELHKGEDEINKTTSFIDMENNILDQTIPFRGGNRVRSHSEDWRITLKRIKAHLGVLNSSESCQMNSDNDSQHNEANPVHETKLEENVAIGGIKKQEGTETKNALPNSSQQYESSPEPEKILQKNMEVCKTRKEEEPKTKDALVKEINLHIYSHQYEGNQEQEKEFQKNIKESEAQRQEESPTTVDLPNMMNTHVNSQQYESSPELVKNLQKNIVCGIQKQEETKTAIALENVINLHISSEQYESSSEQEKKLQKNLELTGKQEEAKTTVAFPNMVNLHAGDSKVTTRSEKSLFEQLRFPLKKLSLYGKHTLKNQLKNARMIKVWADVSEFPIDNYFNSESYSKVFSAKLRFREFTVVKRTRARVPEKEEEVIDDELASVGSYEDFIKHIPVLRYFMHNDTTRDIEEVNDYESFANYLFMKRINKLFCNEGFLFVSGNLVPL